MATGVVMRAFTRISRLGLTKINRTAARYVQGSNQYLFIATSTSLPFAVFFLLYDGGKLWPAALAEAGLIVVWLACLVLNFAGWVRTVSIIELIAPLVGFLVLTWLLSHRAGFILPLIMTGSVAFVTFSPKRLPWGIALTALSAIAVCWAYLDPRFSVPRLDVTGGVIDGLLVGNVILVTAVMLSTSGLNNYYFTRERGRTERQLAAAQDQARTDPLTLLLNRRGMVESLAAVPAGLPYAVSLIDLDRFKEVNDTLGHAHGDAVLVQVADVLKEVVGDDGVVSRWGGEEFLVLMIDAHLSSAGAVIERARIAVEALAWPEVGASFVTFSAGIAAAGPGASWEKTVRVADALLYDAKRAGRNRVTHGDVPTGGAAEHG